MSLYKTKGIVLRTTKLGEADRIINLVTSGHGKVAAVAKGIRKTKSKFGSRLEPFSYVDLLLYKGRNLDIVTQAELIVPFQEIRGDLDLVAHGAAMLDLVDKVAVAGEQDLPLFNLLLIALKSLAEGDGSPRLKLIAFNLRVMAVAGYQVSVSRCAICGRPPAGRIRFDMERGGAVCEGCWAGGPYGEVASNAVLGAIGLLSGAPFREAGTFPVDDRTERELFSLTNRYLDFHLQSRLRSRECIAQLEG